MTTELKAPPTPPVEPLPEWVGSPPAGGAGTTGRGDELSAVPPREIVAVVLSVVIFDLLVYRGQGYAGYGAFFVSACALLLAGSPNRTRPVATAVLGGMVLLLAARMTWLGYGFLNVVGVSLLAGFAMAVAGRRPYVLDAVAYAAQAAVAGFPALVAYGRSANRRGPSIPHTTWLKVVLPALAVLGFGTIFVLANPDVATAFGRWLRQSFDAVWEGLLRFSPRFDEVVLWIVVAVLAGGLLRPFVFNRILAPLSKMWHGDTEAEEPLFETPLYAAYRNTLIAVIGLFAVYLVFEFATLWFRTFPEGFYYAGYAHEGAAWLTIALAATTFVLSAIFRDSTMRDPRLPRLRSLAWVWCGLNLLLALAVYNRLFIYIGFNGMTRMRTVGLFGITAVVVGLLLVVWKIRKERDFAWLIERQLWTLAIAVFVLAIVPVDALVQRYNVGRVLAGDPAPSVQITEHPIDSGGILVLTPLVEAEDPIIREGVKALLAQRALRAEAMFRRRREQDWTSFQLADRLLLRRLRDARGEWEEYEDAERRAAAWGRFREYAYRWY